MTPLQERALNYLRHGPLWPHTLKAWLKDRGRAAPHTPTTSQPGHVIRVLLHKGWAVQRWAQPVWDDDRREWVDALLIYSTHGETPRRWPVPDDVDDTFQRHTHARLASGDPYERRCRCPECQQGQRDLALARGLTPGQADAYVELYCDDQRARDKRFDELVDLAVARLDPDYGYEWAREPGKCSNCLCDLDLTAAEKRDVYSEKRQTGWAFFTEGDFYRLSPLCGACFEGICHECWEHKSECVCDAGGES